MPTECSPALFEFAPVEGRARGGRLSTAGRSPRMPARCCSARRTGPSAWSGASPPASATRGRRSGSSTRSPPWSASACSASRSAMRTWSTTTSSATTRCWRSSPASSRRGAPTARRLAGKSTLNRLEHAPAGEPGRYHRIGHDAAAIEALFVDLFLEAHRTAPAADHPRPRRHRRSRCTGIRRAASSTATTTAYCYLPLYVFCGRHLLAAKLRRANIDASAGAVEEVARIVGQIRARWPRVRILLRADSGFAREALMAWCEANRVDFVFGLARNARLVEELAIDLAWAEEEATGPASRRGASATSAGPRSTAGRAGGASSARPSGPAARPTRASSSPRSRPAEIDARSLYERIYCARGEMENRIKECQLDLFAGRASAATMRANQLRLWFASMAYVLLCALRRIGLAHTQFAEATCGTLRLALLKIGALVRISRPPRQARHGLGASAPARVRPCPRPLDRRRDRLTNQTPQAASAPPTPPCTRRWRSMANLRRAPPSGRRSPRKAARNPWPSTTASRLVRSSG